MQGESLRPMGGNADVIRELERVEQAQARNAQLSREANEFFADATRTAAGVMRHISDEQKSATQQKLGSEIEDFIGDVKSRAEDTVRSLSGVRGAPRRPRPAVQKPVAPEPVAPPAPPAPAPQILAPAPDVAPAPAPEPVRPPVPRPDRSGRPQPRADRERSITPVFGGDDSLGSGLPSPSVQDDVWDMGPALEEAVEAPVESDPGSMDPLFAGFGAESEDVDDGLKLRPSEGGFDEGLLEPNALQFDAQPAAPLQPDFGMGNVDAGASLAGGLMSDVSDMDALGSPAPAQPAGAEGFAGWPGEAESGVRAAPPAECLMPAFEGIDVDGPGLSSPDPEPEPMAMALGGLDAAGGDPIEGVVRACFSRLLENPDAMREAMRVLMDAGLLSNAEAQDVARALLAAR